MAGVWWTVKATVNKGDLVKDRTILVFMGDDKDADHARYIAHMKMEDDHQGWDGIEMKEATRDG